MVATTPAADTDSSVLTEVLNTRCTIVTRHPSYANQCGSFAAISYGSGSGRALHYTEKIIPSPAHVMRKLDLWIGRAT